MLRKKANGDCFYLGEKGCTIWDKAPGVCKAFDCRLWYSGALQKYSRPERRQMLREGSLNAEIFYAGKKRVRSLNSDVRMGYT